MTPFKTIWPDFIIVYRIDSFEDHFTKFYQCVPNWLLSRPFDLIFALCTQLTPFKTIWTQFYHCVPYWLLLRPYDLILQPNWLLSRPFDLISLCTLLTPFKTIWTNFNIVDPIDSFQDHLTIVLLLCTHIDSFQDHMTWHHCIQNWLISRPSDLILSLCTQLTPFKTIWLDVCIVYPIDSFQDHLPEFYHCVHYWLLSRPYDLIFALCTQMTSFKTIWPDFIIVYPIDSLQDHLN